MKKKQTSYFLTLIFLIILSQGINAQWVQQNSGTTSDLYSIYFTDASHGVATGINGLILKTDNGGQLWQNVASNTANHLVSVFFPSYNVGYAAGYAGTVVKTMDGGNSWTVLNTGTTSYINTLYFFDDSTGFAAGNDALIIFTSDGGNTWQPRANGTNSLQDIYKLSFVSPQLGFAALSENPYHGILKTTDGGNSWEKDTIGLNMPFSIFFTDASTGYAVGSFNHIWKTTNGGEDWTGLDSSNGGTYNDVFFPAPGTGYVIGEQGVILKTTDGTTFQPEVTNSTGSLRSVHFPELSTGYVAGLGGLILKKGINTAISDNNFPENNLIIYPNPSKDEISFATPANASIRIATINGQLLRTVASSAEKTSLDISALPKGVYMIEIRPNNTTGKEEVKLFKGSFIKE